MSFRITAYSDESRSVVIRVYDSEDKNQGVLVHPGQIHHFNLPSLDIVHNDTHTPIRTSCVCKRNENEEITSVCQLHGSYSRVETAKEIYRLAGQILAMSVESSNREDTLQEVAEYLMERAKHLREMGGGK